MRVGSLVYLSSIPHFEVVKHNNDVLISLFTERVAFYFKFA